MSTIRLSINCLASRLLLRWARVGVMPQAGEERCLSDQKSALRRLYSSVLRLTAQNCRQNYANYVTQARCGSNRSASHASWFKILTGRSENNRRQRFVQTTRLSSRLNDRIVSTVVKTCTSCTYCHIDRVSTLPACIRAHDLLLHPFGIEGMRLVVDELSKISAVTSKAFMITGGRSWWTQ